MATSTYTIELIPAKGHGVISCSDIAKGTLIVSESPLFKIPHYTQQPHSIQAIVA